ncbi:MAG TPA: hypothetical protein VLF59_03620 [Candidatus Saccharimonadales bacterium]|nr:hypothetical protein [Candidatus Saccharimonadales bacterium]
MNHLIGTPETSADAWLLVRALDRPGSRDELLARYDSDLVEATIDTAYDWVGATFERRPVGQLGTRVGAAAVAGEASMPAPETTAVLHLDTLTVPKSLTLASAYELAQTVPENFPNPKDRFLGRKPEAFDVSESQVVLSALHWFGRTDPEPAVRLEVTSYLARNAPSAVERTLSRLAFRRMVHANSLVQYTDARTTRSRNSPHWLAGIIGGAHNQRRYLRHG